CLERPENPRPTRDWIRNRLPAGWLWRPQCHRHGWHFGCGAEHGGASARRESGARLYRGAGSIPCEPERLRQAGVYAWLVATKARAGDDCFAANAISSTLRASQTSWTDRSRPSRTARKCRICSRYISFGSWFGHSVRRHTRSRPLYQETAWFSYDHWR